MCRRILKAWNRFRQFVVRPSQLLLWFLVRCYNCSKLTVMKPSWQGKIRLGFCKHKLTPFSAISPAKQKTGSSVHHRVMARETTPRQLLASDWWHSQTCHHQKWTKSNSRFLRVSNSLRFSSKRTMLCPKTCVAVTKESRVQRSTRKPYRKETAWLGLTVWNLNGGPF